MLQTTAGYSFQLQPLGSTHLQLTSHHMSSQAERLCKYCPQRARAEPDKQQQKLLDKQSCVMVPSQLWLESSQRQVPEQRGHREASSSEMPGLGSLEQKGHSKAEAPTGERKQQQLWEIWLKIKGKKKREKPSKLGCITYSN